MNVWVLFPLFAFALGVVVSVYLFIDWLRHGRRPWFLLFWSIALFLMYWFQVPVILTNLGKVVTVTDFNFFFALTLPITFLALILLYIGILEITKINLTKLTKTFLGLWFLASIGFFAQQFFSNEGLIQTYALPLVGNLVFYLPIRILIIAAIIIWFRKSIPKTLFGYIGGLCVLTESILGIARNILIIKNVLYYPPEFWYVVLSGLRIFFALQTLSIIVVAIGFFFLHRMYFKTRDNRAL